MYLVFKDGKDVSVTPELSFKKKKLKPSSVRKDRIARVYLRHFRRLLEWTRLSTVLGTPYLLEIFILFGKNMRS